MCSANLKGFASHIHVLYREVPHILCITQLPANCARLEEFASTGWRCPGLVCWPDSGLTLPYTWPQIVVKPFLRLQYQ